MSIKRVVCTAVLIVSVCWAPFASVRVSAAESELSAAAQGEEQSPASPQTLVQTDLQPYWHEESFSSDHSMTGLFSQCVEYFNAGDWDIRSAVFTLRYSATQLTDHTVSSMTFTLNGQIFHSARVEPSLNGREVQEVTVSLPIDALKAGQNELIIDTYVRTNDSLPCVDDVSKANWMQIFDDSAVAISYFPQIASNTLADCYEQFVSIDALENKQSAVLVRPGADEAELTAAALALAGTSRQSQMFYGNIALQSVESEQSLFSGKYRMYISRYDSLLPAVKDRLTDEQKQAAQQGAVMVLLGDTEDSNVLLVTGSDGEALNNAALLLGNPDYMKQARTVWRRVSAQENVRANKAPVEQYRPLSETGAYVKGPFRQSTSFFIDFPANRMLSHSSQVSIAMRYSENLDFDRSLMTVYINDEPVGSQKLQLSKAQGDTAVFNIPSDLRVSGNFSVRVSFDLEIKDLWCTLNQSETPWAWVSDESMLKLSTVDAQELIFENYPSPFLKDGSMNDVVAVLPDAPGEADLEALRRIMLTLGQFLKDNTGSLRVTHMSGIGDVKKANVIGIGRLDKNKIVQQINNLMYFQFSPEGTTLRSNEKMLIDPNYGALLGTAQLLDSPYSDEKRALLLVTGVSDEAMLRAADYLGASENLWKLYGDGYVADGVKAYPFRFKEDNQKKQSVVDQLVSRGDIKSIALTAGLVLFLATVSAVFLVTKYRKRDEDEI